MPIGRHFGPGAWQVQTPDDAVYGVWLLAGVRLHCWPVAAANGDANADANADANTDANTDASSDTKSAAARTVVLHDGALRGQRLPLADNATLVLDGGRWLGVWRPPSPHSQFSTAIGTDFVHDLALTADGTHLALLGSDGRLQQWQLAPVRQVLRCEAARGVLALAADGSALAVAAAGAGAGAGAGVQILRAGTAATQALPMARAGQVRGLAFAAASSWLLCAGDDGVLGLWDVARNSLHAAFTVESPLHCCAASADGALLAAGDEAGQVHFFASINADSAR